MEIHDIQKIRLRNDEHFQFNTEFRDLIVREGAETLKIAPLFATYLTLYNIEDEGVKKISKSVWTAQIHEADKARDEIYTGMVLANESALRHYSEPTRAAAKKLKILFDTYGNVSQKPLNEQTSAVHNILQELRGEYLAAAQTVGINGWVAELETRNNAVDALVKERFDEAGAKSQVVVGAARLELDAAYDAIVRRINALAEVEGVEHYAAFINTFNAVIAKYNAILHLRLGRKHHGHGAGNNGGNQDNNDGDNQAEQTEVEDS